MIPELRELGRTAEASASAGIMSVRLSWPLPRSVTIRVRGEVDLCTAPHLADVLSTTIHSPVDDVVIDLSEVTFLSVCGLNCLLGAERAADACRTSLRLDVGESYAVNRLFSLLRSTLPEAFTRGL